MNIEIVPFEAKEKILLKLSKGVVLTPEEILKHIQVMYPDWDIDQYSLIVERNSDALYPVISFTRRRSVNNKRPQP